MTTHGFLGVFTFRGNASFCPGILVMLILCIYTYMHAYIHTYICLDTMYILHQMDQQEDLYNTCTMSLMDVYQVNDQPQGDPTWHQPPPLLPFHHSFSPCNPFLHILPSIPSSSHNDQNRPFVTLPSHNDQNRPFAMLHSHNTKHHPFVPTALHNNKHCPFIMPHTSTFPELTTGPPLYNTCTNPHIYLSFL